MLSIGRFANLSGLSLHALRHYDDVDLLKPAHVDASSGYRRYTMSQIESARLIRRLRWLDLPVDEIREVMAAAGEERDAILNRHRERLQRQGAVLAERVTAVDHQLAGANMTRSPGTCTPVQIKIAVSDFKKAKEFYETAFGLTSQVTRRTKDEDIYGFMFGRYEEPGFFLLHMLGEDADVDTPGRSTFGLSVDDLDTVHKRAVDAGATEMIAPRTPEGMPRCSAVRDLDENWIWLYQA
jgi:DNA-binding transcriptional MerR regulator